MEEKPNLYLNGYSSSLSSGMTNILKDVFSIGLILISYPYLKDLLAVTQLEESVILYFTAFICIDFASYWNHRLNHSINVFWNRHIVHHSSEEFNLSLRLTPKHFFSNRVWCIVFTSCRCPWNTA